MAVDIDQVAAVHAPRHEMGVPDFLEQVFRHRWNPTLGLAGEPCCFCGGTILGARAGDGKRAGVLNRGADWRYALRISRRHHRKVMPWAMNPSMSRAWG
jgi:hypothetical protein